LRGWTDLAREVALWAGFAVTYEVVRWAATGRRGAALSNAETLIRAERHLHFFVEGDVQRAILDSPRFVLHLADWTYWLAQFVVVFAAFTGVYLFRYRLYPTFRNAFFLANTVGLIVYLTIPLAPPRLFPQDGLVDTLRRFESLNLHSGLVRGLANPYAAMPSLHTADALIVGVMLCSATRRPWLRCVALAWPVWVCTALLATGNHFSLDIAAGLTLGAAAILAARQVTGRMGAASRFGLDSSSPSQRHQLGAAKRPSSPTASRPVS
jgi:membrane-associated phospholipid phosphatase